MFDSSKKQLIFPIPCEFLGKLFKLSGLNFFILSVNNNTNYKGQSLGFKWKVTYTICVILLTIWPHGTNLTQKENDDEVSSSKNKNSCTNCTEFVLFLTFDFLTLFLLLLPYLKTYLCSDDHLWSLWHWTSHWSFYSLGFFPFWIRADISLQGSLGGFNGIMCMTV